MMDWKNRFQKRRANRERQRSLMSCHRLIVQNWGTSGAHTASAQQCQRRQNESAALIEWQRFTGSKQKWIIMWSRHFHHQGRRAPFSITNFVQFEKAKRKKKDKLCAQACTVASTLHEILSGTVIGITVCSLCCCLTIRIIDVLIIAIVGLNGTGIKAALDIGHTHAICRGYILRWCGFIIGFDNNNQRTSAASPSKLHSCNMCLGVAFEYLAWILRLQAHGVELCQVQGRLEALKDYPSRWSGLIRGEFIFHK